MAFTVEHDAFILMAHYRSATQDAEGNWSYSLPSCIDQFIQRFPDFDFDYDSFRHRRHIITHRFEDKHCICKGKSTGRPTKLTEAVVDDIRQRVEHSPHKSVKKLSQQTGISYLFLIVQS